MSNWILESVIEDFSFRIESQREFIKRCEIEMSRFSDSREIESTLEAKEYEFWEKVKRMTKYQLEKEKDNMIRTLAEEIVSHEPVERVEALKRWLTKEIELEKSLKEEK